VARMVQASTLGASFSGAVLAAMAALAWDSRARCVSGSRTLQLTSSGRAGLSDIFQIEISA
jgi:hypothetical protein